MLVKKLLIYTLILSCFVLTTNSFASSLTKLPQNNNSQTIKEVSLEIHSVAEIPRQVITSGVANSLAISADGQVGFFSEVKGSFVYAYDLNTGQQLSKIQIGKKAANLSLFDSGKKRLLAVINLSDPTSNESITVSIIDVSNAKKIKLVSAFILPPELTINSTLSPVFDREGEQVFIASKNPASLFVFETSSGRMLDQIPLTSGINSLSISHQENSSLLAATSVDETKVTIFEVFSNAKLEQKAIFNLPETKSLIAQNNICFNKNATIAYIASAKSNKLFSFDTSTGLLVDSYDVGDVPAQITLASVGNKTKIGIVNTGKNHGFLANSVSIVEASNDGHFKGATVFLPALGANLVADSQIKFSDKGNVGFVGTRNQSLFVFDSQTGEQLAETKLLGSATKFAISKNRLIALTSDIDSKRLVVLNTKINKSIEPLQGPKELSTTPKLEVKTPATIATPSLIKINQVKVYRVRRVIKIRLIGKGFEPSSQILINNRPINTSLRGSKLFARFSIKLLAGKCDFNVLVKTPNNTDSLVFRKDLKCGK